MMIYLHIYRRAALTSFDIARKVYRSLSTCLPRVARGVVRTAPAKRAIGSTLRFKFYRQYNFSAELHTG